MVWDIWQEIGEGRTTNGFGESPVGWPDIASWSALSGRQPSPAECRMILLLDRAYLSALFDQREKMRPKK